jgi:parallel beta-helix repeat protein
VTGPGSGTLSDLKTALPKVPLTQVSPAVWYLQANIEIEKGATLLLHGTKLGGDVNLLRLKSNNTFETNAYANITADWGQIDIRSTAITSWDEAVQGPDTECWTYGRAYIRVRSSLDDALVVHESRMDVIDSDVGYLGFHDAESYGLVWKVNAPKNTPVPGGLTNLYNLVNVYGDIKNSRLHHNFFGMYSFGSYRMQMTGNEVDHNVWYGFDPHDDSDELLIENNNVHDNGTHGIIASQRCNNLVIRNNYSWNNGGNGIMLHRYCDYVLVEGNTCLHNGDCGIALFDSRHETVRNNTCWSNYRGGIRLSVGASDNLIVSNDFGNGGNYGFYLYQGNDPPMPGDDGRPKRNWFVGNYVHNNGGEGIMVTGGDDNYFLGNQFEANVGPLSFIQSRRNRLDANLFPDQVLVRIDGSPTFLSSGSITNQPLIYLQIDPYSTATFEDGPGRVFDPEEGGIATTLYPSGTKLTLNSAQIAKTSTVKLRNLKAIPDAGLALITITIWNLTGDLAKSWLVQAGSTTHAITFTVGDLAPRTTYEVYKKGVPSNYTSDDTGTIVYRDSAISPGIVEYRVQPHL